MGKDKQIASLWKSVWTSWRERKASGPGFQSGALIYHKDRICAQSSYKKMDMMFYPCMSIIPVIALWVTWQYFQLKTFPDMNQNFRKLLTGPNKCHQRLHKSKALDVPLITFHALLALGNTPHKKEVWVISSVCETWTLWFHSQYEIRKISVAFLISQNKTIWYGPETRVGT